MSRVATALFLSVVLSIALSACSVGHIALPGLSTPAPASVAPSAPAAAERFGPPIALGGPTGSLADNADEQTTMAAAKPTPADGKASTDALALATINDLRRSKGLRPLVLDAALTRAARAQAAAVAQHGKLTHLGSDGSTPLDRVRQAGYRPRMAAENIAGGQTTIADAIISWRASETHLHNLLLPDATHMGVARATEAGPGRRPYWTVVLAAPL